MKGYLYIKRFFDVLFAVLGLIFASPILLLVAITIKLDSKGPVLFLHERLGKDARVFRFCKFRSMSVGAEKTGTGVYSGKNDPRVTRVGRVLRALSIDEIPQLINVIRGEMSLIGPRPPLTYHPWPIEEYTDEQKKMFCVRPGLTGWAQVNGRRTVEWNKRIEMNCWYADHVSFLLDLKIFFLTFWVVLRGEDNLNAAQTANNMAAQPKERAKEEEKEKETVTV